VSKATTKVPARKRASGAVERAYHVEIVDVETLHPHPRNYREHPEDQIAHLVESLRAFGIYRNVVVARDGTILAGHGVVKAAKKAELGRIPIVRLDISPDDPQALKLIVADNEIEHLAGQDDRLLAELLKEIQQTAKGGLVGTGFDEKMLAAFLMVTRPTSEIADFDAAAAWAGMPEYDSGEQVFKYLIVSFGKEADLQDFAKRLGLKEIPKKSMWWPPRARNDLRSVKFEG
jgi:hypothetical protein